MNALRGIPVTGWEVSCKFSPHGMLAGRLVTGFSSQGVSRRYLEQLPRHLDIPEDIARILAGEWPKHPQVFLAFEAETSRTIMKAYLEYPRPKPGKTVQEVRVIRGFKWKVGDDKARWHETEYWCLNGLGVAAAEIHVRELARREPELMGIHTVLADVLGETFKKAGEWRNFQLLNSRESSSPRNALGLRFYDSGLKVRQVFGLIQHLAGQWGIAPAEIESLLSSAREREIGWLHAGLGTDAQPFLTLYCAATRADAQIAMLVSDPRS
ncbi:MAG: hypothetical protein ACR2HF_14320 [Methylococcaceae bacterium]